MSEIDNLIDALLEAKSAEEILAARKAIGAWSAELDALRSQVAVLREALQALSGLYTHAWDRVEGGLVMLSGSVKKYDRAHGVAFAALTDTDAAAKEYERELRNRVLEEQLGLLNKEYDAHDNARDFYMAARQNIIRAMTETP